MSKTKNIGPILQGIERPRRSRAPNKGPKRKALYKFAEMKVNDMFFVPGTTIALRNRLSIAARNYGKAHGQFFSVLKFTLGGIDGFGVWRNRRTRAKAST